MNKAAFIVFILWAILSILFAFIGLFFIVDHIINHGFETIIVYAFGGIILCILPWLEMFSVIRSKRKRDGAN